MTIEIAKPTATAKPKDPDFQPALIVFGIDDAGKPHASCFSEVDAELATKAAELMGMRRLAVETDEHRVLASELPQGRVFASGKAFVPFVRKPLYDRLSALAGPSGAVGDGADVTKEQSTAQLAIDARPLSLPKDWSEIVIGATVLMREGPGHGWFEADVREAKGDDLFVLGWRDWPELPAEVRKRDHIALLHPTPIADAVDQGAESQADQ